LTVLFLVLSLWGPPAQAQGAEVDPRGALEDIRGQERSALAELDEIDRSRMAIRTELLGFEERVAEAEAAFNRYQADVDATASKLDQRRDRIKLRLSGLYRLQRRGLARIVFGADDPAQLRRRSTYLLFIMRADLAALQEFAGLSSSKRAALATADAERTRLQALRAELQQKEAELAIQRERRMALMEELRSQRMLAMKTLSEYAATGRNLGDRLALTGGATGMNNGGGGSFRDAYGRLPWPTSGRTKRGYGPYVDPISGARNENLGIDIEAAYGAPFKAVYAGYVKLADFIPGYGQTVAVEHGDYTTIYAHANGLQVRKGQAVQAGDVLGYVGDTGLTDGSGYQLTFEIRYNGTAQDPQPWLQSR
jgi:septal ring factor EnvC (AmiA/AmiB activator)